ncbi:MAG: hypothetical protein NT154_01635 [Verrucomicrobia bacterium]|nr:hypothetical protein [Verrucomicrobiota bacterium]
MKSNYVFLLMGMAALLCGCQHTPTTLGEMHSGFTYVPIDPFSVDLVCGSTTNALGVSMAGTNLLESLPDNAVRIAVEKFELNGNVTYGPAGLSTKGASYKITVDYINADTANVKLFIARSIAVRKFAGLSFSSIKFYKSHPFGIEERQLLGVNQPLPRFAVPGSDQYYVKRVDKQTNYIIDIPEAITALGRTNLDISKFGTEFNVPVYIGIGLRVTADITTYESGINVSGLAGIGAGADAKKLSGSLVVQTLGVNGKSIAAALPIQSDLNQTTTQNAILAIGSIKSQLYVPETVVVPRAVGLYLPFPGGKPLVNAIISELSKDRIQWTRITKGR